LIQTIYQHCLEEGFLRPGDTCADPFGGVALGGLDAALSGIQWIGIELEARFHAIAHGFDCGGSAAKHEACSQQGDHAAHHVTGNLELWNRRFGHLPQWVAPTLLQGDSRRLGDVLRKQVECAVSSPPFQQSLQASAGIDLARRRHVAAMLGIPQAEVTPVDMAEPAQTSYGTSPGQLGALPPGSLDACLSSPPWAGTAASDWHLDSSPERFAKLYALYQAQGGGMTAEQYRAACQKQQGGYGTAPAQLGNLPAGTVEAVVDGLISSPPWDDGAPSLPPERKRETNRRNDHGGPGPQYQAMAQLGEPDTFWSAAATIIAQVVALLKPNGIACWVVKAYVRDGQIVDFPGQWRALCESLGLVTLHEHHALLVEDHGTQGGLFGEDTTHRTEKKSFFRRIYEKAHPENAINHEVIFCMQKPS